MTSWPIAPWDSGAGRRADGFAVPGCAGLGCSGVGQVRGDRWNQAVGLWVRRQPYMRLIPRTLEDHASRGKDDRGAGGAASSAVEYRTEEPGRARPRGSTVSHVRLLAVLRRRVTPRKDWQPAVGIDCAVPSRRRGESCRAHLRGAVTADDRGPSRPAARSAGSPSSRPTRFGKRRRVVWWPCATPVGNQPLGGGSHPLGLPHRPAPTRVPPIAFHRPIWPTLGLSR